MIPGTRASRRSLLVGICAAAFVTAVPSAVNAAGAEKPALFLIGDSTIRNGTHDNGAIGGQFGWGRMMKYYFDTDRIFVVNDAMGGTSSRSFQTSPRLWGNVLRMIRPGDYVMMAFGHNDSRGSLPGKGEDTAPLPSPQHRRGAGARPAVGDAPVAATAAAARSTDEVMRSFGWYMRQFIRQARAKGATPIVLSLIPRNRWTGEKVNRNANDYALWARQAAEQEKAHFIPLNNIIADKYDALGQDKVTAEFFPPNEVVHPNWAGAAFNAAAVIEGLKQLDTPLKIYLRKNPQVPTTPDITPPARGEMGPSAMEPVSRQPAPAP